MAVEARHQFPVNRETINAIETYNAQTGYGSGTSTEALLPPPMYGSGQGMTTALMADSLPISRKRSREMNPLQPYQNVQNSHFNRCGFTFLGEDISLQIQQQQMEIDRFIAHHTAKVRMEIENRRKKNSWRIIAAVEEGMLKRLRGKEEEIERIGKLNWALEEKVKSLSVENQIWRELAQTNEATANTLRTNLDQVLAQVNGGCVNEATGILMDDAESCCGSNYEEECLKVEEQTNDEYSSHGSRSCRNWRKEESACYCFPPEISAPARFAIPPSTFFPSVNPPEPTCPPFQGGYVINVGKLQRLQKFRDQFASSETSRPNCSNLKAKGLFCKFSKSRD